jgi:hypothetical protein
MRSAPWFTVLLFCFLLLPSPARAQAIELAGSRAPGMGGAFVAVASDSSATWWNPAGLAAGPFVDLALTRNVLDTGTDQLPASRSHLSSFALGTPPAGISYYRFRLTEIAREGSTASEQGDREAIGTGIAIRSVPVSQLGVTLVHSVLSGVHVGTTLKYIRGEVLTGFAQGDADALLEFGHDLPSGDGTSAFDLDLGLLAVVGAFRLGGVVRNVRAAELDGVLDVDLPRQVRVGAAFDGESAGMAPVTIALDADVRRYMAPGGERRVVAVGAEHWFAQRRLGVRAGARFNTVGGEERAGSAGISVAVRSGLFLDGHLVSGGSADDRGWGIAARVSF